MPWNFWRNGKKPKEPLEEPLDHPEVKPVAVSAKTRLYFDLVKDIVYFDCGNNTVVYDKHGSPIWECGGCNDCEQFGRPDIYRYIRTGFNMLRTGLPIQQVKESCFHPAYKQILADARGSRIGEGVGGESYYFVNIILHLGGNLDEVLAIMEETHEERQQALDALRDAQEQAAAEKGRIIETSDE